MALFIKTTKVKGYEYIKLVESYREHGKTKHRVLYNFGRSDIIKKDEGFLKIVRKLCEVAELQIKNTENEDEKSIFADCSEATLYNYGYLAYKKLWKELAIDAVLAGYQECITKIKYPLSETVFLMAVQHLLEPRSKLSTYMQQNRYFKMEKYRYIICIGHLKY